MKRILAIATGGTIASHSGENGLTPQISLDNFLHYLPQVKEVCDLHAIQLLHLDSTNMQPENWLMIAEEIEKNYGRYDGFIILHGTDTMAYTAAALSYLIQNSPKPIVLTGSQKPIDQDISDAKSNVMQSILFASDEKSSGVNLVFNGEVIAGTRGRKVRTKSFNAFSSVDFPHKAVVRDQRVIHYIIEEQKGEIQYYHSLNSRVYVLKLIPGLDAGILDYLAEYYDAVVIEGFGVGGIPTAEKKEFTKKIPDFLNRGKVLVITTQVPLEGSDLDIYEVGRIFKRDERIWEAYNMTLESIVTKLMWILGLTTERERGKELFYREINHDIIGQ